MSRLRRALDEEEAIRSRRPYGYGCPVCKRVRVPLWVRANPDGTWTHVLELHGLSRSTQFYCVGSEEEAVYLAPEERV